VVLTDWKMPGMDGIETVRQLLALSQQQPAVIMVTAYGRDNAMAMARDQGVQLQAVLTKPVTPSGLLAAIGQALGQTPFIEPAPDRRHDQSTEARRKLVGARLLLVEDNALNQELALEILRQAGIEVVLASNGQQALDRLAGDGPFDGVLMDCEMPVMDGYAATARIRANPDWAALPVLAMTANTMVGDRERAMGVGMNDHIAKPLDIDAMFNVIGRWVTPGAGRSQAVTGLLPGAATSPELPELPGIDVAVGRARALGRPALYLRLLRLFLESGQQFEAQFRGALAAGDGASAQRLAHTLKGTAGSIEAPAIRDAAGLLEAACKTEPAAVDDRLSATLQTLKPVLAGLAAALASIDAERPTPATNPETAPAPSSEGSPLPQMLQRLRAELDAGEGTARQTLADIRPLLAGSPQAALLEPIAAAITDFDFEQAAQLLDGLTQAPARISH
jgi:CheY-like chemotaxis protein